MLGPKFPRLNKKKVEFAFFKNISPTLVLSGSPCSSIDLRGSPNYIYIYQSAGSSKDVPASRIYHARSSIYDSKRSSRDHYLSPR